MSIPLLPLSYNPIDSDRLKQVLDQYEGKLHPLIVTDFERALAEKTGARHVVALQSGTAAIHLALRVLGVGAGDVVIAPSFTYIATINPILYQGAKPVFVDCEQDTWNMDPVLLEMALKQEILKGSKVKAILVMHNYGMPAPMRQILEIAAAHQVPVIEDAAEAVGSSYQGKTAGTLGRLGILSFNTNKVFTTYGGGAVLTSDEATARKIRFLATQARENLPHYEHRELGYNYLMGALNAAYGLSLLPRLEESVKARRAIFDHYEDNLHAVEFQKEPTGYFSNRWLPAVLFRDEKIRFIAWSKLAEAGFETRQLWKPMHRQPLYTSCTFYGSHLSESLFARGLCLPAGVTLSQEEQNSIIGLVNRIGE